MKGGGAWGKVFLWNHSELVGSVGFVAIDTVPGD